MPLPTPIVFCITDLEMGGAERALVELVTRLPRDRFSAKVISLAPRPRSDDLAQPGKTTLVDRLEEAAIETRFLNARSGYRVVRLVRRLKRILNDWHPSILQTFLFHANVAGTVAGRLAGVPHIVTGIRVAERRRNLHRWLTRCTASRVDVHVCVSQAVADFSRDTTGLPADRLMVIPNGIDTAAYPGKKADLSTYGLGRRRALVYVGRLDHQKRVDWLLDRTPELFARLPDHDLLVVGNGRQRQALERQAERLGVEDHVHFVGWRGEVAEILAAADLLALTSRWEGMPNVVLEAMANGKPVVVSDSEGIGELIGPDGGGQVVGPNDAAGFVSSIVRIVSDRQLADALGRQNRDRVAARFRIEETVAAYERLYASLLVS